MKQMEKTMKKEGAAVEAAASSASHSDTETDSNFLKPAPGFLQSVKTELSFTKDTLVKEEILEDGSQDDSEQQCIHVASTSAGTGGVNEACSTSLGDLFNVKYQSAEIDIGPTVLQPMDIHYTINKHNMSAAVEENTIVDDYNEAMPGSGGRKRSVEDKWRDDKTTSHNCAKTTTEMYYDEAHMKSHLHIKASRPCELSCAWFDARLSQCDASLSQTDYLTKPMRVHKGEKPFHCESCDAKFANRDHLIRHTRVHTGEKSFQCKTCDAKFAHSGSLTMHMRIHTGEKPFRCETCGAKFSHNGNLTKHMRVHTGEKPFRCKTCGAKFSQNGNLTKHMRVHTGEKPFRCETCDATFTNRHHLIQHTSVHTGEKPFHCETCDAKFVNSGHLTQHMRVHTGEKPFQCETCEAKFANRDHLTQHKKVHTGEKPFQCKTCDAKFAQKEI